jgi:3-methyladenine DNA glycosylase AlkD
MMSYEEILGKLKSMSDPKAVAGMARFGINPENTLGVSIPKLRALAKAAGKDHALALRLWESGIHEARILASMVDDPMQATEGQIEVWVGQFDSWDVCDQVCMNLIEKLPFAYRKAFEWSEHGEEFVKRAGFVMMARLAVSDKKADDDVFRRLFPIIKREAGDGRNYVKKAVNWALRQIGKRNAQLNKEAIWLARELQAMEDKAAKWVAADALRELTGEPVQARLTKQKR